jgi:hypothetical protein
MKRLEKGHMRTPLSCLLGVAFAVGVLGSHAAETRNAPPVIVIRQHSDLKFAGRGPQFPGGLIAALWSDGRMIRPAGSNTVGKSYVEGVVSAADREKFFAFLNESSALRNQEGGFEGTLHAAYQVVTVYREGKRSQWTRPLPDRKAGFYQIEERLWSLPIKGQRPVDWQAVRRSSWYE